MKGKKLIPYAVIVAAKNGDSEAMSQILRHYEPYIIRCSKRTLYDEYGNQYQVVDEEIKNRIQSKLMYQIVYDFDPFMRLTLLSMFPLQSSKKSPLSRRQKKKNNPENPCLWP